jgi:outer membrane protein OmpA-like peptidoglycan-associated protein
MNLRLFFLLTSFLSGVSTFAQFATEKAISDNDAEISNQQMRIEVFDAGSKGPASANLRIDGINRKELLLYAVSDTTLPIRTYRLLTISCLKQGYMYYSRKFWPDEKRVHEEKIILEPLKVGLKTDIQAITFIGDETQIYTKSIWAVDELVEFMTLNPSVKLAVIGHVNGPDKEKSVSFYRKASHKRAEAVVTYLTSKGINASRLEARGAGNTQMLYPKPATDWQSEANRRIEIEVIGM